MLEFIQKEWITNKYLLCINLEKWAKRPVWLTWSISQVVSVSLKPVLETIRTDSKRHLWSISRSILWAESFKPLLTSVWEKVKTSPFLTGNLPSPESCKTLLEVTPKPPWYVLSLQPIITAKKPFQHCDMQTKLKKLRTSLLSTKVKLISLFDNWGRKTKDLRSSLILLKKKRWVQWKRC